MVVFTVYMYVCSFQCNFYTWLIQRLIVPFILYLLSFNKLHPISQLLLAVDHPSLTRCLGVDRDQIISYSGQRSGMGEILQLLGGQYEKDEAKTKKHVVFAAMVIMMRMKKPGYDTSVWFNTDHPLRDLG